MVIIMRKIRAAEPANSGDTSGFKNLMKRATTEMLVLLMLQQNPMYTYEIMSELERLSSDYLSFNTLYLAIYRLKELHFINESEGSLSDDSRRVYFSLTGAGREYLSNLLDEYSQFTDVVDRIIAEKTHKKSS